MTDDQREFAIGSLLAIIAVLVLFVVVPVVLYEEWRLDQWIVDLIGN